MTITLSSSPSTALLPSGHRVLGAGPILLATDGTESSDPAFVAARMLAARLGTDVHVISVLEPLPLLFPNPEMLAVPVEGVRRGELLDLVQRQMERHVGGRSGWQVEIGFGDPPTRIAAAARERHASLVITGLNRHGPMDRLLGGETLRQVVQLCDVPVLAVAAGFERLPASLLVAMDFDQVAEHAAQVAFELFPDVRTAHLAHVVTARGIAGLLREHSGAGDDAATASEFARVRARLSETGHLSQTVQMPTVRLWGDPAGELLDFAEYSRAELIVAGAHRRTFVRRLVLGSVATRLLRGARQSVLIVPAVGTESIARESSVRSATQTVTDSSEWASMLAAFGRRNAGRRVVLEIHDPELGAQAQAREFPLGGIGYDQRADEVVISLGAECAGAHHLSHRVGRPTSVNVLHDVGGRDAALRIGHGGGQTLLLLSPE